MTKETSQQWYSGDWLLKNADSEPYNGISITATPNYQNDLFTGVKISINDFTKSSKGKINSIDSLTCVMGDKTVTSSGDFTVNGWIKLESKGSKVYLRIRLSYGLKDFTHNEVGYIMAFDTKKASPD